MLSRIFNIWIIKQRAKCPEIPQSDPDSSRSSPEVSEVLTEYVVDLGHGRVVHLRGLASDLQAITTSKWLKAKTHVDGYLEAAAKLTVYLVAAFSGNLSQIGSIIFLGLLLITAGLLGLSNAHAKTFSMYGRLAAPTTENLPQQGNQDSDPYKTDTHSRTWPRSAGDGMTSSRYSAVNDLTDRG